MRIILCAGENGRAVVIGTVRKNPIPGEPVVMTDARMVLYWDSECGGLFGFAANGPKGRTRITAPIPSLTETAWKQAITVTNQAAEEIDKWPAV